MVKRIAILGLALVFSLASQECFANGSSLSDDVKAHKTHQKEIVLERLERAKSRYEEVQKELTEDQKKICQVRLDVMRAILEGRDEKELLGLYKRLQAFIIDEAVRTQNKPPRVWRGNDTLRRVFGIETPLPWTCFSIARLCRDSEKMILQEKIREIKAQADISNDYRISQMAIELLTENQRYQDALDYCRQWISNIEQGKKKGQISFYQYELIKTRLLYQKSLYERAMQDQGIDWDQVINVGPHLVTIDLKQSHIAKEEAREYIKENPQLAKRCLSLFSSNNSYLGPIAELKEIKNFYESTSSKLAQAAEQRKPISLSESPFPDEKLSNMRVILAIGLAIAAGVVIVGLAMLTKKKASSRSK